MSSFPLTNSYFSEGLVYHQPEMFLNISYTSACLKRPVTVALKNKARSHWIRQDNQRLYPEECYRQMLQWREVRATDGATDGALGNPGNMDEVASGYD